MQLNDTAVTRSARRRTGTSHWISDITTPWGRKQSHAEELTVYVAKNVLCDCCHSQQGGTQWVSLKCLLGVVIRCFQAQSLVFRCYLTCNTYTCIKTPFFIFYIWHAFNVNDQPCYCGFTLCLEEAHKALLRTQTPDVFFVSVSCFFASSFPVGCLRQTAVLHQFSVTNQTMKNQTLLF